MDDVAARTVDCRRARGTAAWTSPERAAASPAEVGASPRRASRSRSRCRPRASRLSTVPTGQPRRRAACSWVRPSIKHSTIGMRYLFGSRVTSSWRTSPRSSSTRATAVLVRRPAASCSCQRRRNVNDREQDATRGRPGVATGLASRHPQRAGSAYQDQECALEGVLNVVGVTEDRPTHPQHHRAMPLDQGRESQFRRPRRSGS